MFTRVSALEGAKYGVRVNAVAPGPIATPLLKKAFDKGSELEGWVREEVPLGRAGTPEEVADAVLFLASAAYVTGAVYAVDGGMSAR